MKSCAASARLEIITQDEITSLSLKKEMVTALRRRLESLESQTKVLEGELISRLEAGAFVDANCRLSVKTMERRYPSWKSHFTELAGAEAADAVLRKTPATITKALLIEE